MLYRFTLHLLEMLRKCRWLVNQTLALTLLSLSPLPGTWRIVYFSSLKISQMNKLEIYVLWTFRHTLHALTFYTTARTTALSLSLSLLNQFILSQSFAMTVRNLFLLPLTPITFLPIYLAPPTANQLYLSLLTLRSSVTFVLQTISPKISTKAGLKVKIRSHQFQDEVSRDYCVRTAQL